MAMPEPAIVAAASRAAVRRRERDLLAAFYGAFAPACFALLGLWIVVVQIRLPEWQGSVPHRRRSYGVALHFALPGVMSLVALVDPQNPAYWRVSFVVIALGGAVVLAAMGGFPSRRERDAGRSPRQPRSSADGLLALTAQVTAISIYALIGALALAGGPSMLRIEALLLIILAFLGFNAAWLLLFDDTRHAHSPAASHQLPAPRADSTGRDVSQPSQRRTRGQQPEAQSP
jgi:hypothetical protein